MIIRYYLLLFLFLYAGLNAQDNSVEFSTVSFKMFYNINENRNEFHEYWNADKSLEAAVEFPFYIGILEAGLMYTDFSAFSHDQPDFSSINYYLLWGERFEIVPGISVKVDGGPGLFQMDFEETEEVVDENLLKERELSLNLNLSLTLLLSNTLSIEGGYTFIRILTSRPIELGYLSAGLVLSFKSPKWLIDLLK